MVGRFSLAEFFSRNSEFIFAYHQQHRSFAHRKCSESSAAWFFLSGKTSHTKALRAV